MNSIANLPSEYHCHRNFYKDIWGECTCHECGSKRLRFQKNYEYCPDCQRKFSVKSETIFRHSNLSFRQIYLLIWCWQHKIGIGEISQIVNISNPTVSRWLERLRSTLEASDAILGDEVEVDGAFFGRHKFDHQQLVIGAIESFKLDGAIKRRIRLSVIPYRTREYAESFIKKTIVTGSRVLTDGFSGYNELPLLGYDWDYCVHENGHFGPTNHIESLWSEIKRALRHIYRDLSFSYKKLSLVLREWENRHNNPELFYNVDNYLKLKGCSKFVY